MTVWSDDTARNYPTSLISSACRPSSRSEQEGAAKAKRRPVPTISREASPDHEYRAQRGNRTLDLFITSEMLCRLSYLGGVQMLATVRGAAHTGITSGSQDAR